MSYLYRESPTSCCPCSHRHTLPTIMTEYKAIELLARKLAGEATPEELAELDRLLTMHPEATFYAELLMQVWQEGKDNQDTPSEKNWQQHIARLQPAFTTAPGASAIEETEAAYAMPTPFYKRRAMRLALFLLLPFIVAGGMYIVLTRSSHRAVAARQEHNIELYAEMGSRKIARLPDGTKVWLNAGSRLRYDTGMNQRDTRSVTLSGEAFFDVVKNKEKPFVIHTGKVAIRVLGTAFNVRAYPGERLTEATLMRGSIELTVTSRPYQKIILKPDEKFALIEDAPASSASADIHPAAPANSNTQNAEKLIIQDIKPVNIADKEYVEEVSWTENEFVFKSETFDELLPRMERWFNVQIDMNNPALKDYHFTGVFHKETIDEVLSGLQMIKPFKYKITNNHVLIN